MHASREFEVHRKITKKITVGRVLRHAYVHALETMNSGTYNNEIESLQVAATF